MVEVAKAEGSFVDVWSNENVLVVLEVVPDVERTMLVCVVTVPPVVVAKWYDDLSPLITVVCETSTLRTPPVSVCALVMISVTLLL